MQSMVSTSRRGDGHLWMIALGLSLAINLVILAGLGFAVLRSALLKEKLARTAKPPPAESVATIFPEFFKPAAETKRPEVVERRQVRTSPEQAAEPEKTPLFEGERNTRATSDRTPRPGAPPLPSQAGIQPRDESEIETTESRYQDGVLADQAEVASKPTEPTPPAETSPSRTMTENPTAEAAKPVPPPPREKLLDGPNPVAMPVPRETSPEEAIRPVPEKPAVAESPPAPKPEGKKPADAPKPKASTDPTFKGYQRKTAVMGSISRTGRSSLDVADTPLGRYQASISRAVELEWQRNCVRHRDFIVPGFLTVRFFVESSGKVRSVQFVGDMETGEVQKGFTLNSIRDADIPAMPSALRKEYDKEPLELIFRFHF